MSAMDDFHLEELRLQRERYAPGTRVLFTSAPGTITRYYSVGAGMVEIMLDRGDTWLVAASRCDIYAERINAAN